MEQLRGGREGGRSERGRVYGREGGMKVEKEDRSGRKHENAHTCNIPPLSPTPFLPPSLPHTLPPSLTLPTRSQKAPFPLCLSALSEDLQVQIACHSFRAHTQHTQEAPPSPLVHPSLASLATHTCTGTLHMYDAQCIHVHIMRPGIGQMPLCIGRLFNI